MRVRGLKALTIAAVICLSLVFARQAVAGRADEAAAEAVKALNAKDFDRGVAVLEQAVSDNPFDDRLKELLGRAYAARGWEKVSQEKYEAALEDFKKANGVQSEKKLETYLGLGYSELRLNDLDDALSYLNEVVYLAPNDARGHELLGEVYYRRGKLEDSVKELESALALKPDDEAVRKLLAKEKKELGVEGSFSKKETYSFNIKYEGEEKRDLGDLVLDVLSEAYSNVGGDLGYYPAAPVNVILYTRKQFTDITEAPGWSGGIFDGNIRVPLGGGGVDKGALAAVLYHEYAHSVIHAEAGQNKVPTWLDEGIAQYEERHARPRKVDLSGQRLMPLSQLSGSFMGMDNPDTVKLAYAESLSAVEYFVDRYGMYSLSQLVKHIGEGKDFTKAMDEAAGVTPDEFYGLWRQSLGM